MSTNDDFKQAALDYHRVAPHGKIKVVPTKAMVTQRESNMLEPTARAVPTFSSMVLSQACPCRGSRNVRNS